MITSKKVDYTKEDRSKIKTGLYTSVINSTAYTIVLCCLKFAGDFRSSKDNYTIEPGIIAIAIISLIGANVVNVYITFRKIKLINVFDIILHILIAIIPIIIYKIF